MTSFSIEPAAHYDRITDAWHYLIGEDFHLGYYAEPKENAREAAQALTRLLAGYAELSKGMEVLDIGCGTGHPAVWLAQEYGCRVTGISTSAVGVERATVRAAGLGLADRVRFQVADGTATGFPNETFDRIWVLETSHLIPQKESLLQECTRLVRPGGRVVLCDMVRLREIPLHEVVTLRDDLMVVQKVFGRAKMQPLEFYGHTFQQLGLATETTDISAFMPQTFVNWRANAEQHASAVRELIGDQSWQQFIHACDVMLRFFQEGRLGYGVVTASKSHGTVPDSRSN